MKKPKRIAFEFDGVVTDTGFWPSIGSIKPMAKECLNKLHELGYYIIISSTRNNSGLKGNENKQYLQDMADFLVDNQIYFDAIDDGESGKPVADVYVGHRNMRFGGNWRDFLFQLVYGRKPKKEDKRPRKSQNEDWLDGVDEI